MRLQARSQLFGHVRRFFPEDLMRKVTFAGSGEPKSELKQGWVGRGYIGLECYTTAKRRCVGASET